MKGQVKALAVAIALAAGSANASIEGSTSGNGELFVSIWDKTAQVAYTKDLGFNMDTWLIGSANALTSHKFSLAGDTNWTSFLNAANESTAVFSIIALDGTNETQGGGARYLTTSKNPQTTIKNATTNALLKDFDVTNNIVTSQNNKGTHIGGNPAVDGSAFTTKAADGNAYPQSTQYSQESWSTKAVGWTTTATVGQALPFFFLTGSGTGTVSNSAKVDVTQYVSAVDGSAATWSVNLATNELEYNVVSTPLPAAAWLLGSALLGLVGVGRRQSKANMVAA